jgi:kynureninase
MGEETVTRDKVIDLAKTMPQEKLPSWYEYGLFLQTRSLGPAVQEDAEKLLRQEVADWEAASDEDWLNMEKRLSQTKST